MSLDGYEFRDRMREALEAAVEYAKPDRADHRREIATAVFASLMAASPEYPAFNAETAVRAANVLLTELDR